MTDFNDRDAGEPLSDGLSALPAGLLGPRAPAELREAIWARTAKAVRARPRRRRLLLASGFIVAYAAGALTALSLFVLPGERPGGEPSASPSSPEGKEVPPSTESSPIPAAYPQRAGALLARAAEEPSAAERERLFREAGDRFLARGIIDDAARCYRKALRAAPRNAIPPSPQDSWLLVLIKNSQKAEVPRENDG